MNTKFVKALLRTALVASTVLLSSLAGAAVTTVNLTAQRTSTTLPDGTVVPMWGYCDGTLGANSDGTPAAGVATTVPCGTWSVGPTITVPQGSDLVINLTNSLPVSTSIVVLGQFGGGLGAPTRMVSPTHSAQTQSTWPGNGAATFTPPSQGDRVMSMGAGVAATASASLTWTGLKPGTYLYETGTLPSIQAPMGLYGVLVVTQTPVLPVAAVAAVAADNAAVPPIAAVPAVVAVAFAPGKAYPGQLNEVAYDSEVALLFSEIDPVQNKAVDAAAAVGTDVKLRFDDATCIPNCYPATVNYAPAYFLINGKSFDQASPGNSAFAMPAAAATGSVLVRFLNAGSRSHVPSIVGLPMSIVAEDGNLAPGKPKVQNEVLLTAGKTHDVLVSPPQATPVPTTGAAYSATAFPVFDRQLSLSAANQLSAGMQAFLQVAGGALPSFTPVTKVAPVAVADMYPVPLNTSINGNVRANDIAVVNAAVLSQPTNGLLTFNADGSFVYSPNAGFSGIDSFTYNGNNGTTNTVTVTLNIGNAAAGGTGAPIAVADTYTSNIAQKYSVSQPGVLANDTDANGNIIGGLTAALVNTGNCSSVVLNANGSFTATGSGSCQFTYNAVNSQNIASESTATVTVNFPAGSGLMVSIYDAKDFAKNGTNALTLNDYRWTLQEDLSFPVDPTATPSPSKRTLSTSFHTSHMPVVAVGCVGPISCGSGQQVRGGAVITDVAALAMQTMPGDVALDPAKRYYISVLPGDAANPVVVGTCADPAITDPANLNYCDPLGKGHIMGGANVSVSNLASPVVIKVQPTPLQPAQTNIFVYEDNNPTNGQYDLGERGLGGFNVILNDTAGRAGDVAGQQTYDSFNMPMTNALLGTPGCPNDLNPTTPNLDGVGGALVGSVYTCPNDPNEGTPLADPAKYALAGHAVIRNITPARYDLIAHPAASREGNGEVWIQVETLEGTAAIDNFVPGRDSSAKNPANFVWGMPGFQNTVGFINPARIAAINPGGTGSIVGRVTLGHDGRAPDNTIYDAGIRGNLSNTHCQVALNSGQGGGSAIAYAQCDDDGNFKLNNLPAGSYSMAVWDQWLDQVIQQVQVTVADNTQTDLANIPVPAWFTYQAQNIYIDGNGNGVRDANEGGISNVPLGMRYRTGAPFTSTLTDTSGNGTMTEIPPILNWVVAEADTTRFKQTGVEIIVDAGGAVDTSGPGKGIYNSTFADCPSSPGQPCSSRRVDLSGTLSYGVQGLAGNTNTLNWGRAPYASGENGGIAGTVVYSTTRPFDDMRLNVQTIWEPLVPRVTVNLYSRTIVNGVPTLTQVDSTLTSSWDDWVNTVYGSDGNQYIIGVDGSLRDPATGVRAPVGVTGGRQVNMQCPGQVANDPLLANSLVTQSGASDQFRCYDGAHNWNQVQKAPYDGRYNFPSAKFIADHPLCSGTATTNCTAAKPGQTLVSLPPGDYVVEAVTPPGYQIVKEEDKNILIGDAFVAPVVQQFGALGSIFIIPDQATLNNANVFNPRNVDGVQSNPTSNLGVTNYASAYPECVGNLHRVPDYLSLFPQSQQVAPFAGMDRALCDRKLVKLGDQMQATATFFVFTDVPVATPGVGVVTDDTAAQFTVASPTFGDKGTLPFVAVAVRDFSGMEIARAYGDQWGYFNLLTPSSWLVNPPTPSGYGPNMLIQCSNDPGPIWDATSSKWITDPQYNPAYMNSCYPLPFMPGLTTHLDTPTLPKAAFAAGYNPADCEYPDMTPAIARVDAAGVGNFGPYLPATGGSLTIASLGVVQVPNPEWAGPTAVAGDPSSLRTVSRNYGFGDNNGLGLVTLGGVNLAVTSWTNASITVTVPGGTPSGQLVVTKVLADDSRLSSTEAVTVTVEAATPKRVPTISFPTIQAAVDAATPGDLILVDAGTYNESVIVWKPVRLQGVGANSVFVTSSKFPVGPMENWEIAINKLFGIDVYGSTVVDLNPQADPLPGQLITGGTALLAPTPLLNVEGPGVTVLAKNLPAGQCSGGALSGMGSPVTDSNFLCAPSRIDGMTITGSEGGGGIYVNGWAHNLEIANNRIVSNASPYFGGIGIGLPYLGQTALPTNLSGNVIGFGYDNNVYIHHNSVSKNGAIAAAGAGQGGAGGGVSIAAGSDNYRVERNLICGNFTQADGAGVGHVGLSMNGAINHNKIVFNQSFQQTQNVNGGGISIVGEAIGGGSVSLGTGSVMIDSNLIRGNDAESGSGGGISLAQVNGADVQLNLANPASWFNVTITNNMIVNNLAGFSGGGIAVADALNTSIINNTIANNDSVGTAGAVAGQGAPSPSGVVSFLTSPELLAVISTAAISNPVLTNNIIWHNRSLYFDGTGLGRLCSSNDAASTGCNQLVPQATTGQCVNTTAGALPAYWDIGVIGDVSAAIPGVSKLAPTFSILSSATGYAASNITTDPGLAEEYCNGSRTTPEYALPEALQVKSIQVAQSAGEGGTR